MRVRTGLVAAIYQKALILSNDERGKASGDIVNLMSVDASRLQDLCTYGLMAVSAPLQVTKFSLRRASSLSTLMIGHARVRFIIQPPGMVRICGSWHHDFFSSIEHDDRKLLEEYSNKADEVQGQAFALDERIVGEYQEVLYILSGLHGRRFVVLIMLAVCLVSSCTLGNMHSSVECYSCVMKRSSRCSRKSEYTP